MSNTIDVEPEPRRSAALAPLGLAELPSPPASWLAGHRARHRRLGRRPRLGRIHLLSLYRHARSGSASCGRRSIGVGLQFFLNMEIERYTLATGETVLTGFSRLGRHWGLAFVVMTMLVTFSWPGWATSSATMITYLVGGDARWIAVGILLAVGLILTLSPVVYRTLERTRSIKAAAILLRSCWLDPVRHSAGNLGRGAGADRPAGLAGRRARLGAVARRDRLRGRGGAGNLCQSNWIRDKGFGMGAHAARIESPLFGEPVAAPGTGWRFEPDAAAMARWRALVAVRQYRATGDLRRDQPARRSCSLSLLAHSLLGRPRRTCRATFPSLRWKRSSCPSRWAAGSGASS